MLYQQGDVLIEKVDSKKLPKIKTKKERDGQRMILVLGELTGHAHSTIDDVEVFVGEDGQTYMKAAKGATITHEQHGPLTVEPGTYQIRQAREYDHFQEESVRVRD